MRNHGKICAIVVIRAKFVTRLTKTHYPSIDAASLSFLSALIVGLLPDILSFRLSVTFDVTLTVGDNFVYVSLYLNLVSVTLDALTRT